MLRWSPDLVDLVELAAAFGYSLIGLNYSKLSLYSSLIWNRWRRSRPERAPHSPPAAGQGSLHLRFHVQHRHRRRIRWVTMMQVLPGLFPKPL